MRTSCKKPSGSSIGVIVESVSSGSPGYQAGLLAGDLLMHYDDAPLTSPAMLQAVEENTVGKEWAILELMRDREKLVLSVPLGSLGVEVRRQLSADVLRLYKGARTAQSNNDEEKSIAQLEKAAQAAKVEGSLAVSAWMWMQTGKRYEQQNAWTQALFMYKHAVDALKATNEPANQYLCAMALGRCFEHQSEYNQAIQVYEVSIDTSEASSYPLWQASRMYKLGYVLFSRGDLPAAHEYFLRSLEIRERLVPESLQVAASFNGLGNVAFRCGDLSSAQDFHLRALEIRERLAPGTLDVAVSCNNLGPLAYERGDLSLARDFHLRSLEIRERLVPESLQVAASFNGLGNVAQTLGDLSSAQDFHLRALGIRERLAPGSLVVAFSHNNLGNAAYSRGDLSLAQEFYLRGLEIKERLAPDSLDVAGSFNCLGNVAYSSGDLTLAQDFYLRAMEIKERLAPGSLDLAITCNNLGSNAEKRGELSLAQDFHIRALEIQERLAPRSLGMAVSFNNLGSVAEKSGDLSLAQDYLLRSQEVWERLAPGSLDLAESLDVQGLVCQRQYRLVEALALHQRALAIVENQRGQMASAHSRALLVSRHLSKYLSLLRCHVAQDQPTEAYATVERCRARSLVEMMAERRIDFVHDAPEDLRKQQQAVDRQRARTYSSLAELDATNNEQVDALHSQLRDFDRQQQELTARMRQVSPRYASLQYPQPLDLAAAQAALDPGTLALVYQMDEEQTYLFALTANQFELFTLPVGRKAVSDHVRAFRESLDVYALEYSLEQALLQAQALYSQLLEPAEKLTVKAERLLICPDGALHILPWAALGYEFDGKWQSLGAEKPLHTALSLTIYAQTLGDRPALAVTPQHPLEPEQAEPSFTLRLTTSVQQIWQSGKRMLAMGDPLYQLSSLVQPAVAAVRSASTSKVDNPIDEPGEVEAADVISESENGELAALRGRGLRLRPLPFTRNEVESIASMFGDQVTLRVGAEATKTNALAECADAAIIHFACHGWLDARQPLSSGLVLAQPEALGENAIEGDNGLLQAWEIFEKVKLNAELVVLSACQTGLGQEVAGEGLIGLTRAFSYAGARSQLVSLWEVNDASTSEFMEAFYRSLKDGNSKDVALQGAIRHMSEHPKWNHPFYWAAFTLHGDWM